MTFELFELYPKYELEPIQDVVRHIERGYRMEAPEGCPADVVRIMHDAWALQPQDRPSFGQSELTA
ncbi:hypothetical protein ANCCAN_16007 [Ancylostoma caninum]|uniref:Serine-threonine/tyrosine-protein kinase catalytic domain-containing protein n=1 Tax=Ancylostoma caninum TaxID=29170 RepID=A0A368G128_ANCCA|nr:hypothetical protein ANCCAN_16007 [Ancylostoma caninum]